MAETQELVGAWRAEAAFPGAEEPITTYVDVVRDPDGGLVGQSSQTVDGEPMVRFSVDAVGNGDPTIVMGNVRYTRDGEPPFTGMLALMQRGSPMRWGGTLMSNGNDAPNDGGTITLTRQLPDWPCSISTSVR